MIPEISADSAIHTLPCTEAGRLLIQAYSKRLLSACTGQAQIVVTTRARALPLDGKNWEIQFMHAPEDRQRREQNHYADAFVNAWICVAALRDFQIERLALPPFMDSADIDERILELSEFISGIRLPPLLVSENWEREKHRRLCQRYSQRQAQRLLMLHGLAYNDRRRLEQAARAYALEVARFYPLYTEVLDEELMASTRVAARLRSAGEN